MAGKYLRKRKFPWIPLLVIVLLALIAALAILIGFVTQKPPQNSESATTLPETTVLRLLANPVQCIPWPALYTLCVLFSIHGKGSF